MFIFPLTELKVDYFVNYIRIIFIVFDEHLGISFDLIFKILVKIKCERHNVFKRFDNYVKCICFVLDRSLLIPHKSQKNLFQLTQRIIHEHSANLSEFFIEVNLFG